MPWASPRVGLTTKRRHPEQGRAGTPGPREAPLLRFLGWCGATESKDPLFFASRCPARKRRPNLA
jgi:hypothetical protein